MSWQGIVGHDAVVDRFRIALGRGRLAGAYLFVGPAGVGKWTFALRLAQTLLCETNPPAEMNPCGRCGGCVKVVARSHPDLLLVAKPPEKNVLPVEMLIGDRDHRMREGLCYDISMKPFYGGRKVAILDDADYLNEESSNALLKTLEEPPPRSTLILIATNLQRQLPTIRSRCQTVRFAALDEATVAALLVEKQLVTDAALAGQVAAQCGGSLTRAVELADPELWEFRRNWLTEITQADIDELSLTQSTAAFVEAAGDDAPPRRRRMRQIFGFAEEFYRQLYHRLCGQEASGDDQLQRAVEAAAQAGTWDAPRATHAAQRCITAAVQVDANANQATLLAAWIDDLAQIARGVALPADSTL